MLSKYIDWTPVFFQTWEWPELIPRFLRIAVVGVEATRYVFADALEMRLYSVSDCQLHQCLQGSERVVGVFPAEPSERR